MSQSTYPAPGSFPPAGMAQAAPPSNGLGLAGFIVSLVGLLTCGLLSPIGAILSLVGVFRQPRGFAIAGLVIGLIGSLWIFVMVFIVGLATLMAGLGLASMQDLIHGFQIASAVEQYKGSNGGKLPPALAGLPGLDPQALNDAHGRPYRYVVNPDGRSFTLESDGADGLPGTSDDVRIDINGMNVDLKQGAPPSLPPPPVVVPTPTPNPAPGP